MAAEKTIPDQVKDMEARAKRCGVSVQTICDQARITPATWEAWEAGYSTPSDAGLHAVHAALAMLIEASDPGPVEVQVAQW